MLATKSPLEIVCDVDEPRELFQHPWRITLEGRQAGIASNGFRLLWMLGDWDYPEAPPRHVETFTRLLGGIPEPTHVWKTTIDDLQLWCPPRPCCPQCGVICPTCRERGERESPWCSYAGVIFNPNQLNDVLAVLGGDVFSVGVTPLMLHVWSESWHFYLMGRFFNQERLDQSRKLEAVIAEGLAQ